MTKKQGKPCKKCTGTLRYSRNGDCVPCASTRATAHRRTAKGKQYSRSYYVENQQEIKKYQQMNALSMKNYTLKRKFGITLEDYDEMIAAQENKCAICQLPQELNVLKRKLAVDHNHKTKQVRGLLCDKCNRGLGFFGDNFGILFKAAEYLRKWEGE